MRRARAKQRKVAPDPKFGDVVMARFMNAMMWDGAKATTQTIFYGALEQVSAAEKRDGGELFYEALANVKPSLEVRSRRVGGATYPVPMQVRPERAQAMAIRCLIKSARKRSEKTMMGRLAAEIRDAVGQRGASVKWRQDLEKMAEANRAFSHYRW